MKNFGMTDTIIRKAVAKGTVNFWPVWIVESKPQDHPSGLYVYLYFSRWPALWPIGMLVDMVTGWLGMYRVAVTGPVEGSVELEIEKEYYYEMVSHAIDREEGFTLDDTPTDSSP